MYQALRKIVLSTLVIGAGAMACTSSSSSDDSSQGEDKQDSSFVAAAKTAVSDGFANGTLEEVDVATAPKAAQDLFHAYSADLTHIYEVKVGSRSVFVVAADEDSTFRLFTTSGSLMALGTLRDDLTTIRWRTGNIQLLSALMQQFWQTGKEEFVMATRADLPKAAQDKFDKLAKTNGAEFLPDAYIWMVGGSKVFVVDQIKEGGSDTWFYSDAGELLADGGAIEGEFQWN